MNPNPFLLAPLCLALAAAVLLLARVASAPETAVTRPALVGPRPVTVAPAHRPSLWTQTVERDAGTRLNRLLRGVGRRAVTTVTAARPAVQRDVTRLSRWVAGRAGAVRGDVARSAGTVRTDVARSAGAARTRAGVAKIGLARLGARLQDGHRLGGALLQSSLRRAGTRLQDGLRAITRTAGTAPWNR